MVPIDVESKPLIPAILYGIDTTLSDTKDLVEDLLMFV